MFHAGNGNDFDGAGGGGFEVSFVSLGNQHSLEPEFLCFRDALCNARDGANLAAESNLACHAGQPVDGRIDIARKHGGNDGEVDGRVCDADAAGDVEEDVLLCEFEADAFLKHGEEHVQSSYVEACGGALRCAVGGSGNQRLRFDEERSDSFDGSRNGDAAQFFLRLRQQELRGVCHGAQSVLSHLIDSQLGS